MRVDTTPFNPITGGGGGGGEVGSSGLVFLAQGLRENGKR